MSAIDREVWYRYEDHLVSCGVDEWCEADRTTVRLYCYEYPVIKHTWKGVWLDIHGRKRFCLNKSKKRFACPSKEEAKESFIARKRAQIGILNQQVKNAQKALFLAGEPLDESIIPGLELSSLD